MGVNDFFRHVILCGPGGKIGLIFAMGNKSALILSIYYPYFINRDFFRHLLINTSIGVTTPVRRKTRPLYN